MLKKNPKTDTSLEVLNVELILDNKKKTEILDFITQAEKNLKYYEEKKSAWEKKHNSYTGHSSPDAFKKLKTWEKDAPFWENRQIKLVSFENFSKNPLNLNFSLVLIDPIEYYGIELQNQRKKLENWKRKYGENDEFVLSTGFAFVTFNSREAVQICLEKFSQPTTITVHDHSLEGFRIVFFKYFQQFY